MRIKIQNHNAKLTPIAITASNPGMMLWRERLFIVLSRNAMNAADYFKIPTNRVVEMGTRIEI